MPGVGEVSLILIPDRTATPSGQDIDAVDRGVERAVKFSLNHDRQDIRRIRSVFYPSRGRYEIVNVEYTDGHDLNIVP